MGACIKFPADFTKAPYTIIASGVTTLPQRMSIPFALINSPSESISGISPAYNEVRPARTAFASARVLSLSVRSFWQEAFNLCWCHWEVRGRATCAAIICLTLLLCVS